MNYEQKHPILQKLEEYLKYTPKEQLDKDWLDILKNSDMEAYYEEKYKQALERAKEELRVCGSQDCDAARQIFRFFPELAESEDDRIKREILELVSISANGNQFEEIKDWIKLQDEKEILIADQNRMIEELRILDRLIQLQDFNYRMKLKEEEVKNRECFLKKNK